MIFDVNLEQLGWNDSFAAQFKTFAADDYIPGRIAREDRGRYSVWTADGEVSGEITGAFRHEHISPAEFPAVGDWVAVEPIPGESKGRIHAVLPRRTVFMRTAAGGTSDAQVAAANVDIMFLVSGLDHDFNVRRIERYLTLAYESGARPVILLNKMDLADDLDSNIAEVEQVAFGVPVHAMSAIDRAGVDVVRRYLAPGVTGAFVGSSGVGKSTLINALAVESLMATSAVREDDSRGRHTTTYRQLFLLPQGGLLIDTPGMRELQMAGSARASPTPSRTSKRSHLNAASEIAPTTPNPAAPSVPQSKTAPWTHLATPRTPNCKKRSPTTNAATARTASLKNVNAVENSAKCSRKY